MSKRKATESLSSIIARLEEWQQRPYVQFLLSQRVGQAEVNSAKSHLIRILDRLEAEL